MNGIRTRLPQTPSQTVGPFFAYGLVPEQYGYPWVSIAGPDMAVDDAPGQRITIEGQVLDGEGRPVVDAMIEIVQADAEGRGGADPARNARFAGFGRCGTGVLEDGFYRFRTIKPGTASAGEAPHVDIVVFMRGLLLHVFTRLYFEGEAANENDPVLTQVPAERRSTLMAREVRPGVWRFDIRMQGDAETVFFDV